MQSTTTNQLTWYANYYSTMKYKRVPIVEYIQAKKNENTD